MTSDTFDRALEIVLHEKLMGHEAGHAAAALLLGLKVASASAPFHTLADLDDLRDANAPAGKVFMSGPPRDVAIATIVGRMEDGGGYWPPTWPLTLVPLHGDEAVVGECVKALGLDEAGYKRLVADAYQLGCSPEYDRLQKTISYALELHGSLDARGLAMIKAISEGRDMEHLTLKAVTTATDQGEFQAVISTENVDREKDIVSATGMVTALRKWNRPIPLAWNHRTDAADIFGHINPETVTEVAGEVVASGQVHLDSDVGREAWRSFKSRAIGFSFGYLIIDATKRAGGGRHITNLDVYEVTATPTPMNNDTRVLATKAIDTEYDHVRTEWRDNMFNVMGATPPETLREKSLRLAAEHAPIQVASFEC